MYNQDEENNGVWLGCCGGYVGLVVLLLGWACRRPVLLFFNALDAGEPWATLPVALAFLLVLVVCLQVRDA